MNRARPNNLSQIVLLLVAGILVVAVQCIVTAQNPWPPADPAPGMKVFRTYSGRTVLSFPNYDIYVEGAPQRFGDIIPGAGDFPLSRRAPIPPPPVTVYRNDLGMRVGVNYDYFNHPAYHDEIVTRYHLRNRTIGNITSIPSDPGAGMMPLRPTVEAPLRFDTTVPVTTITYHVAPWAVPPPKSSSDASYQPMPTEPVGETVYPSSLSSPSTITYHVAPWAVPPPKSSSDASYQPMPTEPAGETVYPSTNLDLTLRRYLEQQTAANGPARAAPCDPNHLSTELTPTK